MGWVGTMPMKNDHFWFFGFPPSPGRKMVGLYRFIAWGEPQMNWIAIDAVFGQFFFPKYGDDTSWGNPK